MPFGANTNLVRYDTQGGSFTAVSSWSSFDTKSLSPSSATSQFTSAAFDGRYLYLLPQSTGLIARYHTTAPLGALSSWTTFDLGMIDARIKGFRGAAFDGEFLYFVPHTGLAVRFDAKTPPSLPLLPAFSGSFL